MVEVSTMIEPALSLNAQSYLFPVTAMTFIGISAVLSGREKVIIPLKTWFLFLAVVFAAASGKLWGADLMDHDTSADLPWKMDRLLLNPGGALDILNRHSIRERELLQKISDLVEENRKLKAKN